MCTLAHCARVLTCFKWVLFISNAHLRLLRIHVYYIQTHHTHTHIVHVCISFAYVRVSFVFVCLYNCVRACHMLARVRSVNMYADVRANAYVWTLWLSWHWYLCSDPTHPTQQTAAAETAGEGVLPRHERATATTKQLGKKIVVIDNQRIVQRHERNKIAEALLLLLLLGACRATRVSYEHSLRHSAKDVRCELRGKEREGGRVVFWTISTAIVLACFTYSL